MGTHYKEQDERLTTSMIISGVVILTVLVVSLIVYLINTNANTNNGGIIEETKTSQVEQNDDFETVSIDIGKSVEEAEKELKKEKANNEINNNLTNSSNTTNTVEKKNTVNTNSKPTNSSNTEASSTEKKEEIKFEAPIRGEIIREFAPDSLVYSDTLEEWVTHNGIDIKADKTSVVKSAQSGTVTAIKTDPRYGLTVIVSHEDGYQTVYANLLTAEYVVEGEQLELGQTIGTVGNTATFEIVDDYHLHFELTKDGEYVNPCNYMEF